MGSHGRAGSALLRQAAGRIAGASAHGSTASTATTTAETTAPLRLAAAASRQQQQQIQGQRFSQLRMISGTPAAAALAPGLNHKDGKVLHPELLNADVLKTQYAVRGELYLRAEQLRQQGKEIIFTNVGNPHQLGAKPITFPRQVAALCVAPFLLDRPDVEQLFPKDAIARARKILGSFKGGMGAYSDSRGNLLVRQEVADFFTKRDGVPSSPDRIFITDGASVAVRMMLNAILRDGNDGILVPIPQYPLYSASIQLYGGSLVPYALDEDKGWALSTDSIRAAVVKARNEGKHVRGLVFINPGNPTGQCLSEDNLKELIKLCYEEKIVLMCDEVYQENVYQDERPFVSARKVMHSMGSPYAEGVEMVSFHTVSKGSAGECGLRGGCMELTNIHPGAIDEVYKCASINLSPNTMGQLALSVMLNPPQPGDESYEQYNSERTAELASLRRRAHMVTDGFNSLDGVTCTFTEGAMYAFPRIHLPPKAIAKAKEMGKAPDVYYCLRLLEATGISTVPGSGFGQAEGTFHLRTTILPREEVISQFVQKFKDFHEAFMKEFA
uniref:Aminotransferase class I/classII large domain-containing protein n=1 Tax=Chlamydomonas euryale TaxID=1486919 RepID=A0A7R9Z8F2_9CHLO|mmetsp:Transcript_8057/g.24301  ORF Transcript_8057/g.24301 Transcript_8057/m.24301 type:complete len:556 (+) Transcript_8057:126-1793(+)